MKQPSVNGFQAARWRIECQWLVALLQKKKGKKKHWEGSTVATSQKKL